MLSHMGQFNSEAAERLIEAHPNIYFLTSHANEIRATYHGSTQPWSNLLSGDAKSRATD
jgi:hypothetical protein